MSIWRPEGTVIDVAAPEGAAVIDRDTLKAHARISHDDENSLLDAYVLAAEQHVERHVQRLLRVRTVVMRLPCLPPASVPIALYGGAVTALTSVVVDGEALTGAVVVGDSPARLVPATPWPSVVGEGYPVVITYQAGLTDVPQALRVAVLMIAAELYERRTEGSAEAVVAVPVSADLLMRSYRIRAI